ncbi:MAG: signal peptidase II [Treponema sp.]|nr:signal peptidase II [Treponema sp.]
MSYLKLNKDKALFLPFLLTAFVVILDQATKAFVVRHWPRPGTFITDVFGNDFLILFHVRNPAIAFSIGYGLPQPWRLILFIVVPIIVLIVLVWYYFHTQEFSRLQRWAIAGIIGGGIGNIGDRIFRPEGVVDFISVRFFGIFGMERWPTFNVADSAVVVSCLILLVTMLKPQKQVLEEAAVDPAANANSLDE